MNFTEELIEEIAARLRSLVANYKKNQKKSPETKVSLEFYDPENETNLNYSLEDVPDISIILEELEFPEKVKIDYLVDGLRKKTLTLFETKPEKQAPRDNYNFPPNYIPNQFQSTSPDFREIMVGLERMVGGLMVGNKEIIDSSLKLQRETISEMKGMMQDQVLAIKQISEEKIKFEANQKNESIKSIENDYSRKIKLETENFEERLKQGKEHQEKIRELEIEKAKLSKDSSSKYVEMTNATLEITKAIVEAAKEVVPVVMETMQVVKASQAVDVTPIPAA